MQRVAIARALINNPDILLADEPTGALDSETSVQVMELLKQVANDRLVIMVTHNPELAEEYSTRIVKLKDGKIIGDTNPFNPDIKKLEKPEHKNLGKASMSIFTALSLSLNNLLTKKGRTFLTAFAGSIGIIGIALILSLSTGFQNYIDKIQEDTLISYPLTITSETADTTSMLLSMVSDSDEDVEEGIVKEEQYVSNMFSKIGTNDLKTFKNYLENNEKQLNDMVSLVQYSYNVNPLIYTKDSKNKITQLNPSTMLTAMTGSSTTLASTMGVSMSVFNEMVDDRQMLESQYKVIQGRWPENFDEVILILPSENEISDLLVYSLGLRDSKELETMLTKIMAGEEYENTNSPLELTYDELMNISLKLVDASEKYKYNEKYEVYEDMSDDEKFMKTVYKNALDLKIVGIVCPDDSSNSSSLMSGIGYTSDLTKYVINKASESEIVNKQLADSNINVFTGKRFDDDSDESTLDFNDLITIDTEMLSSAFGTNISEKDISNLTQGYMTEISSAITADTSNAQKAFSDTLATITKNMLNNYIKENEVAGIATIALADVDTIVDKYMTENSTVKLLKKLENEYLIPQDTFASMYSEFIKGFLNQYISMMAQDQENPSTFLVADAVEELVTTFAGQDAVITASQTIAIKMTEATMQKTVLTKVGELTSSLMQKMANVMQVDESKIASAFQFNLNEEELQRLITTMTSTTTVQNATSNLASLGYQNINEPTTIAFYFKDFDSKELFLDFLEEYNTKMESEDDEKVIKYTDITGILMSSVKVIVNSVSYVLIAFVSISLVVSSIMIGIITYISVLERTKEIGVLRAIGASKRNVSSIFNAETFIIGLCSGILGILTTLVLLIPINYIIQTLTNNIGITAVLPMAGEVTLIILSVILTLIGGLIPSKQAAKKDPVLALRTE